jgi:hypothetical protein
MYGAGYSIQSSFSGSYQRGATKLCAHLWNVMRACISQYYLGALPARGAKRAVSESTSRENNHKSTCPGAQLATGTEGSISCSFVDDEAGLTCSAPLMGGGAG